MLYNHQIIQLLKKSNHPISFDSIFNNFFYFNKSKFQLNKQLKELIDDYQIFKTNNGEYFLPNQTKETINNLDVNPKGFGFVKIKELQDKSIMIFKTQFNGALNGDLVKVVYFQDPFNKEQYQGYVKDVLEKNNKTLVGVLIKNNDYVNFEPLNKKIIGQFIVEKAEHFNHDDIVKVEIIKVNKQYITLKVIKFLFNKNQDFSTTSLLIEENNLDLDFSSEIDKLAKDLNNPISNIEKEKQVDLTNKLFVTIDGEDTKDFDDAILVEKLENNNFLLSVAISDVSYYVKEDSLLDQEAYKRATSIYLLEKTIPMLPFHLSNGICSLSPNDERLVVVCQVEIDANGNEKNIKLFRGIIKSKARLTYKQVNEFWFEKNVNKISNLELQKMLILAKELSDIISKTQHEKGYINFKIKSPKIIYDNKTGKIIDVKIEHQSPSELMIENFMVKTNEIVASFLNQRKKMFIFRVHDAPTSDKLNSFNNLLQYLKIKVDSNTLKNISLPKNFSLFLEKIYSKNMGNFFNIFCLQTMSKAIYSANNIGHFGLASKYYCHFTSPIRRYPDLINHRILINALENKNDYYNFEQLNNIAIHCSKQEQKASELENQLKDMKLAEFFASYSNRIYKGEIVGITKFGFYVDLFIDDKICNGFVSLKSLESNAYQLVNNFVLSNQQNNFKLGDTYDFKIISCNKMDGKIDLIPIL